MAAGLGRKVVPDTTKVEHGTQYSTFGKSLVAYQKVGEATVQEDLRDSAGGMHTVEVRHLSPMGPKHLCFMGHEISAGDAAELSADLARAAAFLREP